jgi:hypothetical protein
MSLPDLDKNWERWIFASVFKFFKDQNALLTTPYHVFIEGEKNRKTNQHSFYLELRADGPFFKPTPSFWRAEIEVNVLVSCNVDHELYRINRASGDVTKILSNTIPIYKLGNGSDDDPGTQIGCLRLEDRDGVRANKFGQIEPKTPLLQATVEAKYWVHLP